MHSATLDNPAILAGHTPKRLHMGSLPWKQWLVDCIRAALPRLLEMTALIVLLLIPWNTAW